MTCPENMNDATKITDTSTYLIDTDMSFEIKTIALPHVPETTTCLTAKTAGHIYKCTIAHSTHEIFKSISRDALLTGFDFPEDCNITYITDMFLSHVQPMLKNMQEEIPWM